MIALKNIAIIGGDKRTLHIYNSLKDLNYNISLYAFGDYKYDSNKIKEANIIILPIISSNDNEILFAPEYKEKIKIETLLKDINNAKIIIGGKIHKDIKNLGNKKYIEYINDKKFKSKNAILTVEAAISIAINNYPKSIYDSKILIIGFGEIGKYLSKILTDLGADIVTSARKETDFKEMKEKNIKCIHTADINKHLYEFDIIFNTVPHQVLYDEALQKLDKNKLIIDLASYPYGLEHSNKYNCKILLELALPGRYSPISASEIITKTVIDYLSEVKTDEI